jgi:transposase, IS30 family
MSARSRGSARAGRPAMRSPGRPSVARREERQRFWRAIAAGCSSEEAAAVAGVSAAVGVRWFREGGGMPSVSLRPTWGRHLSFTEREEIALLRVCGAGVREIARRLRRSPSTISRELRRNAATRSGSLEYRATTAQWHADRRARRPKPAKLATNEVLRRYVQELARGHSHDPGRRRRRRTRSALDRPAPRASKGSSLGELVEPRADRAPAPGRVSR